jgi:hypothetical protein
VLKKLDLDIADIADIDCIEIKNNQSYVVVRQTFREAIVDMQDYANQNTLVWTHSQWVEERSALAFKSFSKNIYIIRDPRDAVISLSHFAFTPYRILNDSATFRDPQDWLDKNLGAFLRRWASHVTGHLSRRQEFGIYPVFYERFLAQFDEEFDLLLVYLGIELGDESKQRIRDKVTAKSMKKGAPHHIRKAQAAQWKEVFTEEQKARAYDIVGPLLKQMGYPEAGGGEVQLPYLEGDLIQLPPRKKSLVARVLRKLK